jgi:2-oxo-3-hexenedioate decarboxylase
MTPQQLLQHNDNGELWPADAAPLHDLDAAYRTALAVRALRQSRGEQPRGYKIGFTNRTIWPRYQVFAPIWGTVWDTTLSMDDGHEPCTLPLGHLCQPRIEPEAVFGFKATPRAGASDEELFEALDWVAAGFEIVQSHLPDWKFVAAQTVADGGLHAKLLVGRKLPIADVARNGAELHQRLAASRVNLLRDGLVVDSGSGALVLDSPLRALQHFLQTLRACPGATDVAPGDVVTTGTWTDAWPVQVGQSWAASFDSVLPELKVRFV